ncbi:MAG: hypothetical protein MZU97_13155 [Bacillus subtilis]|nr:hypothetical protein [Bacillus subtilis]
MDWKKLTRVILPFAVLMFMQVSTYWGNQWYAETFGNPGKDLSVIFLEFNQAVPFLPWTIWPYIIAYPFWILGFIYIGYRDRTNMYQDPAFRPRHLHDLRPLVSLLPDGRAGVARDLGALRPRSRHLQSLRKDHLLDLRRRRPAQRQSLDALPDELAVRSRRPPRQEDAEGHQDHDLGPRDRHLHLDADAQAALHHRHDHRHRPSGSRLLAFEEFESRRLAGNPLHETQRQTPSRCSRAAAPRGRMKERDSLR